MLSFNTHTCSIGISLNAQIHKCPNVQCPIVHCPNVRMSDVPTAFPEHYLAGLGPTGGFKSRPGQMKAWPARARATAYVISRNAERRARTSPSRAPSAARGPSSATRLARRRGQSAPRVEVGSGRRETIERYGDFGFALSSLPSLVLGPLLHGGGCRALRRAAAAQEYHRPLFLVTLRPPSPPFFFGGTSRRSRGSRPLHLSVKMS